MTSVARAGHLAPYFKATCTVVSNGLKPVAVAPTPVDKTVVQPLPKTSTVQSLNGALPIQNLKVKHPFNCKYPNFYGIFQGIISVT